MTDYEKELLADFESSEGESSGEAEIQSETAVENGHSGPKNEGTTDELSFEERLNKILRKEENRVFESRLEKIDIERIEDPRELSDIVSIIPEIKRKIAYFSDGNIDYSTLLSEIEEEDQTEEHKFIISINDLTWLITNDIQMFDSLVKSQYKVVFPELETLVRNPVDYARIVRLLKQDLLNIKDHEDELRSIVSNEKVLVISMASMSQVKKQFILNDNDMNKILVCCKVVLELNEVLQSLSEFISSRLSGYTPNMCAIVGPSTTSQLLIASGSLKQLSMTPSCNIPALGVRELSSETRSGSNHIRQTGYLYHSDLIRELPTEIVKPAMRIVSAKLVLAARIDFSGSSPAGDIGVKYLVDIKSKLEKLIAPPENRGDKALPVPSEYRSKRRGGRRFRKMKERFQMSDVRKAQNRMVFGEQEDSITDAFGGEIGLGMSRNAGPTGGMSSVKVNSNTNAKMSKSMAARLESQKQAASNPIDELDAIILAKPSSTSQETTQNFLHKKPNNWFTGLKRKHPDHQDSPNDSAVPR